MTPWQLKSSIYKWMATRVWERWSRFWRIEPDQLHSHVAASLPDRIWFYPIDKTTNTATFNALDSKFKVKIPLHPFFGCIGVAPAGGEARSCIVPPEYGGNMDPFRLWTLDAGYYELLSKVAKIHLDEMVDPKYVVVASIDKKFLPPGTHPNRD